MLLAADADLIARDSNLPGLRILLDPELFCEIIQEQLPSVHLNSIQPSYLRYKPGTSCLAGYQVMVNGLAIDLHATAYRSKEQPKLLKSKKREVFNPTFGAGVLLFPETAILVSIFPNDRKLKSLAKLNSNEFRKASFQKIFEKRPDLLDSELAKLRYKPERRYVSKLSINGEPKCVLKCYLESDFFNIRSNARIFRSSEKVRVPRKIAHSKKNFWIVYEWMEGHPLDMQQTSLEIFRNVGSALAELHGNQPEEIRHLTRERMVKQMIDQVDDLCVLYPDSEQFIRQTVGRVAVQLHKESFDWGPTHGDFNATQVLQKEDCIAFLDLDEVVYTDVSTDLGNFIANLERDALLKKISLERATAIGEAFLDGYRRTRNTSQSVEPYTALGLFKLISEPFRLRSANWYEQGKAILQRIQAILSESAFVGTQLTVPPLVRPEQPEQVAVIDPFNVLVDPKMPFLAEALSPLEMQFQFGKSLRFSKVHLQSIRVSRYKPGKRCLLDYEIQTDKGAMTLIGKARAKGLDRAGYQTLCALHEGDFGQESFDQISVPAPVGVIPDLHMYLQRKVRGMLASELFRKTSIPESAARIAEAIHKLHQAKIPVLRSHAIADEMRILRERLAVVIQKLPSLADRIKKFLDRCEGLAENVKEDTVCGIHRDFYADQVLFSKDRIFLLDFDSYCKGSPALDAGNFLAHLTEQSMREFGTAEAWKPYERAFRTRFLQLTGAYFSSSVEIYELLSLARHIYLSTQFVERSFVTEPLLDLCENRMASLQMNAGRIL
jgi:Ser/Thr protein kinase RdoA (MazF antagonist)